MNRILTLTLAGIGAFTLLTAGIIGAGVLLYRNTGGDIDLFGATVHSINVHAQAAGPDNINHAVQLTDMAGGAAGSCNQYVALVMEQKEQSWWTRDRVQEHAVLEISCSADIQMRWLSAKELAISYSLPMDGVRSWMRRKDKSNRITVVYELRQV